MQNGAYYLKNLPLSNGKLGVIGFCFGGGIVNELAVAMGSDLQEAATLAWDRTIEFFKKTLS